MPIVASYLDYSGHQLLLSGQPQSYIEADKPGDQVRAANDPTQLSDSAMRAILVGGPADDSYMVSSWQTTVREAAGGGVDTIYAWTDYTLPANVENLVSYFGATLRGNALANVIVSAGDGAHILGGAGDDVLVGAPGGDDIFEFAAGSGRDAIVGFETKGPDADVVRLRDYGFTRFDQVKAAMTQTGADVVLRLDADDALVFRDAAIKDFSAQNFQLGLDMSQLSLAFDDEFDSLSLYNSRTDSGVWKTSFPFGDQTGSHADDSRTLSASDNSIMIYVDPAFPGLANHALGVNPFSIDNGVLEITAQRTPAALKHDLWNYEFTSGLITTEASFTQTYGYFEMSARVDTENGAWPAFWLLPADVSWPPEIDVMESIGGDTVYFHSHSNASGEHTADGFSMDLDDLETAFHAYGVLWTPTTITWYLDGVAVAVADTPADMHKPMYMLANLAVGGDWAGDPDASVQSLGFEIDYIRAYSLSPSGAPVVGPDGTPPVGPSSTVAEITDKLIDNYTDILLVAPTGAALDQVRTWADQIAAGATSFDQAVEQIIDLADQTTSVASLTYQFFRGETPSSAGLHYLVADDGGNPNNLNSAYYASFNTENRYINFAINVGTGAGVGAPDFSADYADLSFAEATTKAYIEIFGDAPSAGKVADILDAPVVFNGANVTREAVFDFYGQTDLGAKAAMVGWLLAVAAESDTGMLAHANEAYLADLLHGAGGQVNLVGDYAHSTTG